jgi:hypothetical protein
MGKSSKKSSVAVAPAAVAVPERKSGKKGKKISVPVYCYFGLMA